ncbi:MAG: RNA polymerase sigma factor [Anaerolineae bacterium]
MLHLQEIDLPVVPPNDEAIDEKRPAFGVEAVVAPTLRSEMRAEQDQSDRALLRACRKGDTRAWETLLDKYERLVFSIALGYGLSRDDAADITQITFTILLQSLERLDEDSRLGPWLATVARRHTWRLLKRQRRERVNDEEDLAGSDTMFGRVEADFSQRWELLEWLEYGLSRIGERCHKLLLALYYDTGQPSYAEVAARFEMSVGSIGPTRARCLKRLKEVLQGQ